MLRTFVMLPHPGVCLPITTSSHPQERWKNCLWLLGHARQESWHGGLLLCRGVIIMHVYSNLLPTLQPKRREHRKGSAQHHLTP